MTATAYELVHAALPGLQGWWKFNEGSGTTATDAAGTIGNMTYSGSGITYGQASILPGDPTNTCVLMDGANGRATRASESALNITSAISIGCWVQPSDVGASSDRSLIYKPNFAWGMMIRGSSVAPGAVKAELKSAITSPGYSTVAGGTYLIVATYDGAIQRLLINGSVVASGAATGALGVESTSFEVGSWLNTVHYKGLIQHPSLANQGWSVQNVRDLYVAGYAAGLEVALQTFYAMPWSRVLVPSGSADVARIGNPSDTTCWVNRSATAAVGSGLPIFPQSVETFEGIELSGLSVIHGAFMGGKHLSIDAS